MGSDQEEDATPPYKILIARGLAPHGRFLRLIRELLQAGYLEDWKYNATLSGAPQGGIVSPLLSNIYLTKLDKYVEETLLPTYTKGDHRRGNPPYQALCKEIARLKKKGQYQKV